MSQNATTDAAGAQSGARGSSLLTLLSPKRISGIYIFIGLIVFYSITTTTFLSETTLRTIASEQAITAILAMGLTVALAAGVFDLSIGGVMGLSNIIVARLMADAGMDPIFAILLTLAAALVIGLINGILVTKAKIDPFIATLGMNSILLAGIAIVSQTQNILGVPEGFLKVASNEILGIPITVFYMLALALVLVYILQMTPIGRRLYATGGGREVARLAGVPTDRYIIGAFMTSATVAAIGGILIVATVGTGSPAVGPSYLLPAFAAGFLGATQFFPGRFNIWGTVLAVYLLATGVKGLVLMGSDPWVTDAFNGLALIIAVGLSGYQGRARRSREKKTGAEESSMGPPADRPTTSEGRPAGSGVS